VEQLFSMLEAHENPFTAKSRWNAKFHSAYSDVKDQNEQWNTSIHSQGVTVWSEQRSVSCTFRI
jgi:hypothetical protein